MRGAGRVIWLTEDEVAQVRRELGRDSTNWLGDGFSGQFNLAGAQAKTALLYQGGRWGIRRDDPTTHILKPAIAGLAGHDLNEHLCLDAARRCGLPAVTSRITRFGDQSAIVVDRTTAIRPAPASAAFTKRTFVRRSRSRLPGNTRMKAARAQAGMRRPVPPGHADTSRRAGRPRVR